MVWQWVVPADQLTSLKQTHIVSGTVRRENGVLVRVVSRSAPAPQAQLVPPDLEDVYLHLVSGNGGGQ
jgi:ABC-2 type transport system ATP-binding protein